jgi:hypothetical protein
MTKNNDQNSRQEERQDFSESKTKKGGANPEPSSKRPSERPKGQGNNENEQGEKS